MVEFRFSDFFDPWALASTWTLMRRSERWPKARFERYQARRLAALLPHCSTDVPYYRSLFGAHRLNVADLRPENAREFLSCIPVLDKNTLREKPEQFLARDMAKYGPRLIQTSGTTGTPLNIYWDRPSNILELCSMQRVWRWAGVRPGDGILDLRSRTFSDGEKFLVKEGKCRYVRNWKVNGLDFSADIIDSGNIHEYYKVLLRYRPQLVRGHPQAIQYVAALLQSAGLDGWRPKAVTTASEALYEYQRREIEDAWNVRVLDTYGLKEHNVFIAQCMEGSYHDFPEYGLTEILDDNGNAVKAGEEGWVVATGLHNLAQPLLRYNTRDRAVAGDGTACRCGRTLPVIQRLVGRIDDCIYSPDGKRYSGLAFALFGINGIKKARFTQREPERVEVELMAGPEFRDADRQSILAALQRKVEDRIQFDLRMVNDIVQKEPGKFKLVVSMLRQPPAAAGTNGGIPPSFR